MKRKAASRDFSINDLPSNRKEVFFDSMKNRYRYLLYTGFILFFTMIPFIIIITIKRIYLNALLLDYTSNIIKESEYIMSSMTYAFIFDILISLSSLIISLGISGLSRIIRQIGWMEPIFFLKDFTDGIKMNYKQISIHILVLSLIYMMSDLALYIGINIKILKYLPMAIFIFIVIPCALYNIAQANIYNISNFKSTTNSLLFFFKSVPISLVFTLIILIPSVIGLIPNIIINLLINIILLILLFPLYYLAWFLYSSYIFDKYLNIEAYPEIVDKGIRRKTNIRKERQ